MLYVTVHATISTDLINFDDYTGILHWKLKISLLNLKETLKISAY